jgi:hypothetical protein
VQEKPSTVVYGGKGGAWLEDWISFRLEWLLGVLLTLVGLCTFALFGRLWTDWVSRASRQNTPINTHRHTQRFSTSMRKEKMRILMNSMLTTIEFQFHEMHTSVSKRFKELHWALMYLCCCAIWTHRKYR